MHDQVLKKLRKAEFLFGNVVAATVAVVVAVVAAVVGVVEGALSKTRYSQLVWPSLCSTSFEQPNKAETTLL